MPIFLALLGMSALGIGAYKITQRSPFANKMGEIYAIGLMGVPANAGVELVGDSLAKVMGWNASKIVLDGGLARGVGGLAVLTVAFRASANTPPLPSLGTQVKIGDVNATVTFVLLQPAVVGGAAEAAAATVAGSQAFP